MEPLWKKYYQVSVPTLLTSFGLIKPGIPVIELSRGLGIEIYYNVSPENKQPYILVDKSLSELDRRVSIAQQLGCILGHADKTTFTEELLIPKWMLSLAIEKVSTDVVVLAKLFQVPVSFMIKRLHSFY